MPMLFSASPVVILVVADANHVGRHGSIRLNLLHESVPDVWVPIGIGDVPNVKQHVCPVLQNLPFQSGCCEMCPAQLQT